MNRYSVDRIENGFAIVEYDDSFFEVNISNLPQGVTEGTILFKNSDGRYEIDVSETERLKKEYNALQNSLFNK